jgi:thymidylate synthase (FAD)
MPPEFIEDFHKDMETIQQMYRKWRDRGLKKEDARFVLPNACVSEIMVSANFREWRHIFKLRTSAKAQWEIRRACRMMLAILKQHAEACSAISCWMAVVRSQCCCCSADFEAYDVKSSTSAG